MGEKGENHTCQKPTPPHLGPEAVSTYENYKKYKTEHGEQHINI